MPSTSRGLPCPWLRASASIALLLLLVEFSRVDVAAQEKTELRDRERIILRMETTDSFVDRRLAEVTLHDKKIRFLTEQLPFDSQPGHPVSVSRDGKTIAYLANESAPPEGGLVTWTLLVRSPDDRKGKGRSLGVTGVTQIDAWSPDGQELIVTTRAEGDTESERQQLVNAKTGAVRKLPLPRAEAPKGSKFFSGHYVTDWSPDGSSFLTVCVHRDKSEKWHGHMYLVKREGSVAKRLTHIPSGVGGKFSPDGKRILFVGPHTEDGKSVDQLYVTDVSGGELVRVSHELNGMLGVFGYCWSPDGNRIAYVWDNREDGDDREMFLMLVDTDGRNPQVLCSRKSRGMWGLNSPNWR